MPNFYVWVGGLKGVVQEKDLTNEFEQYGSILHVKIIRDQETKKSKHCGLVVFDQRSVADNAARKANGSLIHGGRIIARGPTEQQSRGHSGVYEGKIGYIPSISNDKRPYTDCIHYVNGTCTNGFNCPYRHNESARRQGTVICPQWTNNQSCTKESCLYRHPGPNSYYAADGGPVIPLYSLSLYNQDDGITIQLASQVTFQSVKSKFIADWAKGTAPSSDVKAVFVIENHTLRTKWTTYKSSLPSYLYPTEEHYHGTRLSCNITENKDLCSALDCGVCRIAEAGFDERKIRTNIPSFQRFGHGFYLAPKSSKCHDYTQGAYTYRALLVCDVCVGRKYELTKNDQSLNGPPPGYHSIYGKVGGDLKYEEIVLPKADAIFPKYIIIYRKDGEQKIAK